MERIIRVVISLCVSNLYFNYSPYSHYIFFSILTRNNQIPPSFINQSINQSINDSNILLLPLIHPSLISLSIHCFSVSVCTTKKFKKSCIMPSGCCYHHHHHHHHHLIVIFLSFILSLLESSFFCSTSLLFLLYSN